MSEVCVDMMVLFAGVMLEGSKVAWQLLNCIFEVCKEWMEQFPVLSAPVDKTEISMFGMKNTRRKMEDRYAICLDVNSLYGLKVMWSLTFDLSMLFVCLLQGMPCQMYYAVFDGHNGEAAAVYASTHLLTNIVRSPSFESDLAAAIKDGVRKTDAAFCRKVRCT